MRDVVVPAIDCSNQRRPAVAIVRVHGGAAFDQRLQGFQVARCGSGGRRILQGVPMAEVCGQRGMRVAGEYEHGTDSGDEGNVCQYVHWHVVQCNERAKGYSAPAGGNAVAGSANSSANRSPTVTTRTMGNTVWMIGKP